VVQLLQEYAIAAATKADAPGVYVAGEKIASLGLRIRRGCSYHGLALNVDIDLEPFGRINPCGYQGLQVTSMAKLLPDAHLNLDLIGRRLLAIVAERLRV
jgi:lipoyl(octanoyl) transferase